MVYTYIKNDNDYMSFSPLKEAAISLKVPTSQLLTNDNITFQSLTEYMYGKNVYSVYEELLNRGVELEDIIFVYFDSSNLKNANKFLEGKSYRAFGDITDFDSRYNKWVSKNKKIVSKYRKEKKHFTSLQKELSTVSLGRMSPIFVLNSTIMLNPTYANKQVNQSNGINIFESSKVNRCIPYIQYNSENKKYYKIWKNDLTDHSSYILNDELATEPNSIYFTLWVGNNENKKSKNSYEFVRYDLVANTISIEMASSLNIDKEEILNRIRNNLSIDFEYSSTKVVVEFYLYDMNRFDPAIFLDFVLTNSVVNEFVFYNEIQKAYPIHSRYFIYLKDNGLVSLNSTRMGINLKRIERSDKPVVVENKAPKKLRVSDENGSHTIEDDSLYLYVQTDADSIESAQKMAKLLNNLIHYTIDNQEEVFQFYKELIPDYEKLAIDVVEKSAGNIKGRKDQGPSGENIKKLKDIDPEVFGTGYARSGCQSKLQPKAVYPDQKDQINKELLPFPRDQRTDEDLDNGIPYEPNFYFYCDGNKYKFPGISRMSGRPEGNQYVPCCFGSVQMTDSTTTTYKYYKNIEEVKTNVYGKITTDKFVTVGNIANLPIILEKLFDSKYKGSNFVRMGVPVSPNSMIHALLKIVGDINYLDIANNKQKDLYVESIRKNIKNLTSVYVMKQELYDWTSEQILKNLNDTNSVFDSSLYYRALEEIFNLNIFVFFTEKSFVSGRSVANKKDPELEIPRHKIFHTRQYRPERRTVILYKHWGSESDNARHFQYEIIGRELEDGKYEILYDDKVYEYLYKILNKTHNVRMVYIDEKRLVNRLSIHNFINIDPVDAIAQIIDSYGKTRGLIYENYTMYFPPIQPFNLPNAREETLCNYEFALNTFGEPSSVDIYKNQIRGLWFTAFDIKDSVYVPINYIDEDSLTIKYIKGKSHPLFPIAKGPTNRFRELENTIDILYQVFIWLYKLFDSEGIYSEDSDNLGKYHKGVSIFFQKYVSHGKVPYGVDTNKIYKGLFNIPVDLWEEISSVERGIEKLNNVTNLVKGGKIVLHNSWMLSKMMYQLERYVKYSTDNRKELNVMYSFKHVDDFSVNEEDQFIIGEDNFKEWKSSLTREHNRLCNVRKTIQKEDRTITNPIIYKELDTKRTYIIQNVNNGDKQKALAVSYRWQRNKINIGYDVGEIAFDNYSYIVYQSIDNQKLSPIETEGEIGSSTLELLFYGDIQLVSGEVRGYYAALLPIM